MLIPRPIEQVRPHFRDFLRGTAGSNGHITIGRHIKNPESNVYVRNMYVGPERECLPTRFELRATGPNETTVVLKQAIPAEMARDEEIQALTDIHNFYVFTEVLAAFCDRMNGLDVPEGLGVEY